MTPVSSLAGTTSSPPIPVRVVAVKYRYHLTWITVLFQISLLEQRLRTMFPRRTRP